MGAGNILRNLPGGRPQVRPSGALPQALGLVLPLAAPSAAWVRVRNGRERPRLVLAVHATRWGLRVGHGRHLPGNEAAAPMVRRLDCQAIPAPAPLTTQPRPELRKAGLFLWRVRQSQELVRQHLNYARIATAPDVQRAAMIEAIAERVDLSAPGQDLAAVKARYR